MIEQNSNFMNPILEIIDNNVYFIFQDKTFSLKDNEKKKKSTIETFIKEELKSLKKENPEINENKIYKNIKEIFDNNTNIKLNSERYKNYVSNLTTYIDNCYMDEQNNKIFYLHIYILPSKEFDIKIDITNKDKENGKEGLKNKIKFLETLSLQIFKEYSKNIETKDIQFKALKNFNGNSFLELDIMFYYQKLKELYDILFSHNSNYITKVISDNKIIGIPIRELNLRNNNKQKIIQKVNVKNNNDIIIFIYSLLKYLEKHRLSVFENNENISPIFKKLKLLLKNIENKLLELSHNRLQEEIIINKLESDKTKKEINNYFKKYENNKEVLKNPEIFNKLKEIFNNLISDGTYVYKSIDIAKFFEKSINYYLLEKIINEFNNNLKLFIGDENQKSIYEYKNESNKYKGYLDNKLFSSKENKFGQFPDTLIINENNLINEIYDAKYYLLEDVVEKESIFLKIYEYKRFFQAQNKKYIENKMKSQSNCIKEKENTDINTNIIIPERTQIIYKENSKNLLNIKFIKENYKGENLYKNINYEDDEINILSLKIFDNNLNNSI
jgi:hypothetical protein